MPRSKTDKKNQRSADAGQMPTRTSPASRKNDEPPRYPILIGLTVLLAVIGVGVAGFLVWPLLHAAPPVTTPDDMERYPQQLRSLIEKHVAAANGSPRDARERATLGLAYEANDMWPEARKSYVNATMLQDDEPMWPYHAAIAWLETGDIEGATVWLRESAERFPTFTPIQHRLGLVLLDAGEIDEAQAAFERVIAGSPQIASGYVGFGDARLRAGDHEGAAVALEKAVKLDPTNKLARYLLGRAYRSLGRMEDAERELTLGMGAQPRVLLDEWSRELKKYTTGYAALQEQAADFIKAGQPARAVEILETVCSAQPTNVNAAVNLGIAYLDLGQLPKAEEVLLRAERLDSTRFETYINLAACYRRLERFTDALRFVDRAIELSPTAAQAQLTRGLILLQTRDNVAALEALTAAKSFDPRNPAIIQELANVYARLGRQPEALTGYQSLARLLPNRWEPHLGIARAYYAMGMYDEASAAVTAGLGLAPNEPNLLRMARHLREIQEQ